MSNTSSRQPYNQHTFIPIPPVEEVYYPSFDRLGHSNSGMWAPQYENINEPDPDSACPGSIGTYPNRLLPFHQNDLEFNHRSSYSLDSNGQSVQANSGLDTWNETLAPAGHNHQYDCSPVTYPPNLVDQSDDLTTPESNRSASNGCTQKAGESIPRLNQDIQPHLYAPVCLSASRPSFLLDWSESQDPSNYQSLQDDACPSFSQNWITEQDSSHVHRPNQFKAYSLTAIPTICGPFEEGRLETNSLPDLSRFRQQTTPSETVAAIASVQAWNLPQPFTHLLPANPNEIAPPPSFSPRSHDKPAPPVPPFTISHPEIRLRNSSFALTQGLILDTPSDYTDCSLVPHGPKSSTPKIMTCISIPSTPQLFSNMTISKPNTASAHSAPMARPIGPILLPPFQESTNVEQTSKEKLLVTSSNTSNSGHSKSKEDRPKRKRMHVCDICGKDFNRPSALLLHSSVHTGERSNFCNVCGRSFSNLSNLRRHQRQLHVLESEMPLPPIPGPQASFVPYTLVERELFGF